MILWPEQFVTVPRAGTLRVWATNADTLHAATLHPHDKQSTDYSGNPDAQRAAESVRVHGVDYRLLLHLRRVQDDHLRWYNHDETYLGWVIAKNGIQLRRADDHTTAGTDAARRHVFAVLFHALAEWAVSPPGGALLAEADRRSAREQLGKVEAEIDQLQSQLADREAERDRLRSKLQ